MIPPDVETFTTEGEKQFYRFLENVAKPDSNFIAWYTPNIDGKEPDFVLFGNTIGLVVFEVKDWGLEQIVAADPNQFRLNMGGVTENRKNPYRQAREYFYQLMNRIEQDGRLVSQEPGHHGKPRIPITCGVIFPNINKYEYSQKGLDNIIGATKILFWDDLHTASDICTDPSGKCFQDALESMFEHRFRFSVTVKELDHLKQLIFPLVKIELPERKGQDTFQHHLNRLKSIDHHQEALARRFDGGHRIISGPSGSGKTLILVHKAAFLKKYNPAVHRLLFVCYNITLVNYIRRLLAAKGVPLGKNGVDVCHIFELCSLIVGESVPYENEDAEYYDIVIQEALARVATCGIRYDAILVDEGQDMSGDMYRVITALLNPRTNHLTIVHDENQNIYRKSHTWKDVGVHARGRVHRISYIYRNTMEITNFAARFLGASPADGQGDNRGQLELFPDFFDFHGPEPELIPCGGLEQLLDGIADRITVLTRHNGLPFSEIAVLYSMKTPGRLNGVNLPLAIRERLEGAGILCTWTTENYQAKRSYDITTDSVSISTIHSAKGLDYACVFLVGLDFIESERWSEEQIQKLTYVGITRARYQLFIPFIDECELIRNLLKAKKD
ncbi:MAG: DEAD/DEAH box helicase [Thermodesulfobacteriota bacterium]